MFDKIKCSFRNIIRKKGRSFLTVLGISIGIMSVIIISNISSCGMNILNNELDSLGLGGILISGNMSEKLQRVGLSQDELDIIQKSKNVKTASPIIMKNVEVFSKEDSKEVLAWGIDSRANQIVSLNTVFGRTINKADVKQGKNVCMIDQNFSKVIYGRENIIGKKVPIVISGLKEEFEVIGIIKTGSGLLQNMLGEYVPNFLYMPYTTMQKILNTNSFDQIAVKLTDTADVENEGEKIVERLEKIKGSGETYRANNLVKQRDGFVKIMDIVTLILASVGGISLIVASLSIMTVMLVSVNERTHEIGIKKSIGAKQSDILIEFLLEALFLTLIGCFLGITFGMLVSYTGAFLFGFKLKIRYDIIKLSFIFSAVSGILFGVYPAIKASKLQPVDALKYN